MDCSENFPFFQQNKNITNKTFTRNQPPYSEDEDYFSQHQQQFNTNLQNNSWNFEQPDPVYQPDLFEPYTRNEQTPQSRQFLPPKQNSASYNNNFQSQNPIITKSYQPTQIQSDIP